MNNTTSRVVAIACLSTALLVACKPADTSAPASAPQPRVPETAEAEPVAAPVVEEADVPDAATASAAARVVGADYPAARDACLAEVAKQAGVRQDALVATDVLRAEAGIGVIVTVPDADAPWSCLSDEKGNVQGAVYTGVEGKF